jgi:calcineurin-like phosphoesterase family protein
VQWDDTLLFHGDFCFGGHYKTPNYRNRINCQDIHFIRGNHDKHIDKYKEHFSSIQDYMDKTLITTDRRKIPWIGMHYSMRVWLGSHNGFIHTYGHSHGSLEWSPNGKSMDVGIDNAYKLFGEYRPFALEEVVALMDARNIAFHDHHTAEKNAR